MVRIGENRTRIEAALGIGRTRIEPGSRVVTVYDYGPGAAGARRAAEASIYCLHSLGGALSCPIQRSLAGALAESSVEELQGSVLQVVYDEGGVAEWVVFGSTVGELDAANRIIDEAERGDAGAALLLGKSLAEGANGLPADKIQAYRWLSVSMIRGDGGAARERDRIRSRLAPEDRERIDRELQEKRQPSADGVREAE